MSDLIDRLQSLCDRCLMAPANRLTPRKPLCADCQLKHEATARIANLEAVLTKISKMDTGEWSREDMAAVARDALLPLS